MATQMSSRLNSLALVYFGSALTGTLSWLKVRQAGCWVEIHLSGNATNQDLASQNVPTSLLTQNNFRFARHPPRNAESIHGTAGLHNLISAITRTQAEFWKKIQLPSLLRETDLAYQLRVTWIGAQGIEPGVGPEAVQLEVVLLVCNV
jgi:hypothetical protein